jgi:hypothetical protein
LKDASPSNIPAGMIAKSCPGDATMDPQARFCHHPGCPTRGQAGLGNNRIHSRAGRRYRCTTCRRTFAETRDTPFYRLKKTTDLGTLISPLRGPV